MAKAKEEIIYYSRIRIHWATAKIKLDSLELVGRWTYKVKDSAIQFMQMETDISKPAVIIRKLLVPLYNVAYVEEDIDNTYYENKLDEVTDDERPISQI